MVHIEEVLTGWELGPYIVFLEVARYKHCKGTTEHEEIVQREYELDVFVVEGKFLDVFLV